MTDTNGAKDDTRLTQGNANEHDSIVPADGGTFGVDGDESGFGNHPLPDHQPIDQDVGIDAVGIDVDGSTNTNSYDSNIDLNEVDRDFNEGSNGATTVPAEGGTFGVTEDRSGYRTASGNPTAAPYGDNYGVPNHGDFGAFSPPAETPAMAPPQYGTQVDARPKPGALDYLAAALGFIAVLVMVLPSIAYMIGGVLGIVAVVLGAMGMRGPGRLFAVIGVITGSIAIMVAVATALLVHVF